MMMRNMRPDLFPTWRPVGPVARPLGQSHLPGGRVCNPAFLPVACLLVIFVLKEILISLVMLIQVLLLLLKEQEVLEELFFNLLLELSLLLLRPCMELHQILELQD